MNDHFRLYSSGAQYCFGTDATGFSAKFPGLRARLLTLKVNFYLPGAREFGLASGLCSATKEGMDAVLR